MPLRHDPGHAQVGFGEALAEIAGVEGKIHFFAMDLPDRRRTVTEIRGARSISVIEVRHEPGNRSSNPIDPRGTTDRPADHRGEETNPIDPSGIEAEFVKSALNSTDCVPRKRLRRGDRGRGHPGGATARRSAGLRPKVATVA